MATPERNGAKPGVRDISASGAGGLQPSALGVAVSPPAPGQQRDFEQPRENLCVEQLIPQLSVERSDN